MDELLYNNLLTYLTKGEYPNDFNQTQQNKLKTQSKHYHVQHELLYKKNHNNTNDLIRVLKRFEVGPALYMFHNNPTAIYTSKEKIMKNLKTFLLVTNGMSAGKKDQINKKIFFEIINDLNQMIKSTSILLKI